MKTHCLHSPHCGRPVLSTLCSVFAMLWGCAFSVNAQLKQVAIDSPVDSYLFQAVNLALTFGQHNRQYILISTQQGRQDGDVLRPISQKKPITLFAYSATDALMERYSSVTIPLYFGYGGRGILVIRTEDITRFSHVNDVAALSELVGLETDNPTINHVLRENQLTLISAIENQENLHMLTNKQVDYVVKSVLDLARRQGAYEAMTNLSIENQLELQWHSPVSLFMDMRHADVVEILNKGMQVLNESGMQLALFRYYYGDSIAQLNLSARRTIPLNNPLLKNAHVLPTFPDIDEKKLYERLKLSPRKLN